MKSKTFKGKNEADLEQQIWDWQKSQTVTIKEKHPIELLPLEVTKPAFKFAPLPPLADAVSIRVDYEDSN